MTNININGITIGTKVGRVTLVSKKRVLCGGDTRWDLVWSDGKKQELHGQHMLYGVG